MLQILGESFLIATRMDHQLQGQYSEPKRAPRVAKAAEREKRRGWLRLAGLQF